MVNAENVTSNNEEMLARFAELSIKMVEVMKACREMDQYLEMEQRLSEEQQSELCLACTNPSGKFSEQFRKIAEQIESINGHTIDIEFDQYEKYYSSTDIMMNLIYNLLGSMNI